MITIWKTPIVATVEQVLKDLKLQLYGAGLLKEIKNTGSDLMCTCPFHANGKEHNPSCGVLLQKKVTKDKTYEAGTVHCYTCGYTADLPQFVADLLGLSSPVEGFKWLVNQYNYQTEEREIPDLDMYRGSTAKSSVLEESLVKQYTQNLLQSEEACRYLHKRRIANWVLEAYELGFDPEDKTVLFPVRGMDGKVIFYKGRSIAGKHFYNAKEVDKTSVVFGLWEILNGSFSWGTSDQIEEVWITESEIDTLSLISYGVPAVEIREDYAKELSVKFNAEMAEKEKLCDEYVAKFDKFIEENPTLMRLTKGTKKINYNSPQQVACLFYDIFKLKSVSRKEPRGTGDKIVQQHRNKAKKAGTKKGEEFIQFLDNYQRYKECGKLLGTYIDKIPEVKCAKTNAVHTTYNQYGAKTGRFSSSDTVTKINLQNIPSHEKSIRKIFRARDGYKFVGGDFSQIEPRVLSYVSGDEAMQEAYREGKDLYAIMGSKVYVLLILRSELDYLLQDL